MLNAADICFATVDCLITIVSTCLVLHTLKPARALHTLITLHLTWPPPVFQCLCRPPMISNMQHALASSVTAVCTISTDSGLNHLPCHHHHADLVDDLHTHTHTSKSMDKAGQTTAHGPHSAHSEVLHCVNRYFQSFVLYDHQMTFIYELDPYPLEIYWMCAKAFERYVYSACKCMHLVTRGHFLSHDRDGDTPFEPP